MTKLVSGISALSICVIIGAFAFAQSSSPDPAKIWNFITQASPYTAWSFWPDHEGMQPGRSPHGSLHKVFVNDRGLNSKKSPVQYGTVVVKENYNQAKELKAITVMCKVNDFNPAAGDWLWAKYSPDGKAEKFGKIEGCIGCHAAQKKNDYIMVHELK
jgi:hypothetical protein